MDAEHNSDYPLQPTPVGLINFFLIHYTIAITIVASAFYCNRHIADIEWQLNRRRGQF